MPEDLVALIQDVVDSHPGLGFLKEATEFHSRYVHTVSLRTSDTLRTIDSCPLSPGDSPYLLHREPILVWEDHNIRTEKVKFSGCAKVSEVIK